MSKIKNIIGYGTTKLNTYKFKFNDKVIMLDFGFKNLKEEDVNDVDYLFITHDHFDHFGSLLEYTICKYFKKDIRIFTSITTKEIISYFFNNQQMSYIKDAESYMKNLWDNIEGCYHDTEYILDNNIKFKLFKAGHTFGSSMIYVYDDEETLLFTGDIDYVKRNYNRQYYIPYGIKVDTLIVDGTNLLNKPFKGVKTEDILSYAEKKNKELYYKVRIEKGVLYAYYLVRNRDDFLVLYNKDFKWFLDILTKNGYDPYIPGKIMYKLPYINYEEEYPNKTIINLNTYFNEKKRYYSQDTSNDYCLDSKIGLHITPTDLKDLIESKFINYPSRIFIGHFRFENEGLLDISSIKNAKILRRGDNYNG